MTPRNRHLLARTFSLVALASGAALAQPIDHLSGAQKAYAAVDYESTRLEAKAALEQGGNDRATASELYVLLGTAAAALERMDEARVAFCYALATDPALELDRALSPKMRAPFQEARGKATTPDGLPPLRLSLARQGGELELALRDRLEVAASLELWSRSDETHDFSRRRFEPARVRRLPLPRGAELQYYLRVLDGHSNVLFELGTREDPRRVTLRNARATAAPPPTRGIRADRTPYLVTAASLSVLGLAAGGVGAAMFVRREDAAREWNGPRCEQPGSTRREQCAAVDERRRDAERWAIGSAVGGGALLVSGLVTWMLAPTASSTTSAAVDLNREGVMVRLRTAL